MYYISWYRLIVYTMFGRFSSWFCSKKCTRSFWYNIIWMYAMEFEEKNCFQWALFFVPTEAWICRKTSAIWCGLFNGNWRTIGQRIRVALKIWICHQRSGSMHCYTASPFLISPFPYLMLWPIVRVVVSAQLSSHLLAYADVHIRFTG